MQIALACSGLGRVWRGYERHTQELFDLVKDDLQITLFKGGGKSNLRERTLFNLRQEGIFAKLPRFGRDPSFYQLFSFALSLVPFLAFKPYAVVHYIEPGLGNMLFYIRSALGMRFKLMFTNGVGLPANQCSRVSHLHQVSNYYYQKSLDAGMSTDRVTLVPHGIHCENFIRKGNKRELRSKYSVPQDRTVVLSVAALNRHHKRMDYLIREMARLDGSFFLLILGRVEDPSLSVMAETMLPGRHKIAVVPFDDVPEIYNLADIFVHTALEEGFGLALVEAMCAELPVLAHRSPHFRWLMGSDRGLIDMSKAGVLADALQSCVERLSSFDSVIRSAQQAAFQRFDWKNLKPSYLKMYEKVLRSP